MNADPRAIQSRSIGASIVTKRSSAQVAMTAASRRAALRFCQHHRHAERSGPERERDSRATQREHQAGDDEESIDSCADVRRAAGNVRDQWKCGGQSLCTLERRERST